MAAKQTNLVDTVFKDKDGKLVIWQNPNIPLWGWIVSSTIELLINHGGVHNGFQRLGTAFLFIWAYLEIRSGESVFRRILGGIIMAGTIFGFFKLH